MKFLRAPHWVVLGIVVLLGCQKPAETMHKPQTQAANTPLRLEHWQFKPASRSDYVAYAQLLLRFNQPLYRPGESVSSEQLAAIQTTPALPCLWSYAAPDTLACELHTLREGRYQVSLATTFTAIGQPLAQAEQFSFDAGGEEFTLRMERELLASSEAQSGSVRAGDWSDEQLNTLRWRGPDGQQLPVQLTDISRQTWNGDTEVSASLQVSFAKAGVYQLIQPTRENAAGQLLPERELWRGTVHTKSRFLHWYCQDDSDSWANVAKDPRHDVCASNLWVLDFVGRDIRFEYSPGDLLLAPKHSIRDETAPELPVVAAQTRHPTDGRPMLQFQLAGGHQYQFLLGDIDGVSANIRFQAPPAAPLWQLSDAPPRQAQHLVLPWPQQALQQREQQLLHDMTEQQPMTPPTELARWQLAMPQVLSQQEQALGLMVWQRRFYSASELQQGLNDWWQTTKEASPAQQLGIPTSAWRSAALWQRQPLQPQQVPGRLHHVTPVLAQDARPYLAWYQVSSTPSVPTITAATVQGMVQQAAFDLLLVGQTHPWLQVSDWQQLPVANALVEQVCPAQGAPKTLGYTNAKGQFSFNAEPSPQTVCWLWVSHGERHAAIEFAAPSKSDTVDNIEAHLTSTKPMYLLGEDAHVVAVLRQRGPHGVQAPPAEIALRWQLRDAADKLLSEWPAQHSRHGLYSLDIPAALIAKEGWYEVQLVAPTGELQRTTLVVQEYQLPLFEMTLKTADTVFGRRLPYSLHLESFSGKTLAATPVHWRTEWRQGSYHSYKLSNVDFSNQVQCQVPSDQTWSGATDQAGDVTGHLALTSATLCDVLRGTVSVETTDLLGESQRQQSNVLVFPSAYLLGSSWQATGDATSTHSAAELHINAYRVTAEDPELTNGQIIKASWRREASASSTEVAVCAKQQALPISCALPDSNDSTLYLHVQALVHGEKKYWQRRVDRDTAQALQEHSQMQQSPLSIEPVKPLLQWQEVQLSVYAQQAGPATLFVKSGVQMRQQALQLQTGVNAVTLPLDDAMAPAVSVLVYQADGHGQWLHDSTNITLASTELQLPLNMQLSAKIPVQPASSLTATLTAAEDAEVALYWLDDSLLYLAGDYWFKQSHPNRIWESGWPGYLSSENLAERSTLQLQPWVMHPSRGSGLVGALMMGDGVRHRAPVPPPPVTAGGKPVAQWLGVHSLKANQGLQLTLQAPDSPGRWKLVAYAAARQKVALTTAPLQVLTPLQLALQGPVNSTQGDEPTVSVLWFNPTATTQQQRWLLSLNGKRLNGGTVNLASGQRLTQTIALPAVALGSHQLQLQLGEGPDALARQQAWQVVPNVVEQQQILYTDESGLVQVPIAAQQVQGEHLVNAAVSITQMLRAQQPNELLQLLSQWLLYKRLTGQAPPWSSAGLDSLLQPYVQFDGLQRFVTTSYGIAHADDEDYAWMLLALRNEAAVEPLVQVLLKEWREALADKRTISAQGWWLLASSQPIELEALLQARSQQVQVIADRASLPTGPLAADTIDELLSQRLADSLVRQAQFVLALRQMPASKQRDALVATWQQQLLDTPWQEESYHGLDNTSACWLLQVVPWHEPRIAALKLRLQREQQATGHFGSASADLLCALAFQANGQGLELLTDTPLSRASEQPPKAPTVALQATAQTGYLEHSLAAKQWLQLRYQLPLAAVTSRHDGMQLHKRWYKRVQGSWQATSELQQGDLVKVELTLDTPVSRQHIRLQDLQLPGTELLPKRFRPDDEFQHWQLDAQASLLPSQPRQVTLYAEQVPPGQSRWVYYLQIKTAGRFQQGIAQASALYDPTVVARTGGAGWIEVKP